MRAYLVRLVKDLVTAVCTDVPACEYVELPPAFVDEPRAASIGRSAGNDLPIQSQYKRYVADVIFDTEVALNIERAGQPFDVY